jgi:glycosyltransferase involved in cell wall biosynthesis
MPLVTTGELVSVIVPARNSSDTIGDCLRSIRRQSYAAIQLIVVDNGSVDATPAVAQALADTVLDVGPERSAQRNAGARASDGGYLVFIDSDMVLRPDVVLDCVRRAEAGADAVVIPEVSFGAGFWARCKALERRCYHGDETIEAARFFSRDTFFAVGGYDETIPFGPEDWDIHARVVAGGGRVARADAIIDHDEGALVFRELLARKYYYGKSTARYIRKHRELARRQLTVFRPAFFRHWRLLARHPLTAVAMLAMKACELSAGAAGLLVARVRESA